MEATIMSCINEATDKGPIEVMTNGTLIGLEERERLIAEISFKAGIKEVVTWIEINHGDLGSIEQPVMTINGMKWQGFKKSKGIE